MSVVPSGRVGTILLSVAATVLVIRVLKGMSATDKDGIAAKILGPLA